jgi:hypothetical protein
MKILLNEILTLWKQIIELMTLGGNLGGRDPYGTKSNHFEFLLVYFFNGFEFVFLDFFDCWVWARKTFTFVVSSLETFYGARFGRIEVLGVLLQWEILEKNFPENTQEKP